MLVERQIGVRCALLINNVDAHLFQIYKTAWVSFPTQTSRAQREKHGACNQDFFIFRFCCQWMVSRNRKVRPHIYKLLKKYLKIIKTTLQKKSSLKCL